MTPPTHEFILIRWVDEIMSIQEDADRFHNRKNPRLTQYDYSTPNYYFITICSWDKTCIFGSCSQLNSLGTIAQQLMQEIPVHFPNVKVDKFVIMPNHIHAILILDGQTNLSTVIGQYKAAVTKQYRAFRPDQKIWQTSFHDHVIRNQEDYERIWAYIDTNPVRWMDDCFYTP